MRLKTRVFVEIFHSNSESFDEILRLCYQCLAEIKLFVAFKDKERFKSLIKGLLKTYKQYWKKAQRSLSRFNKARNSWVESEIDFVFHKHPEIEKTPRKKRGRQEIPFNQKSTRGQQRTIFMICSIGRHDMDLLLKAGMRSARLKGNKSIASSLQEFIASGFKMSKQSYSKMSASDGLALLIDANLSQTQYQMIRNRTVNCGVDVIPSYKNVREEKQKCLPAKLEITPTKAHVSLQNMMNHTTQRIIILKRPEIEAIMNRNDHINMQLTCKWGFDGSSGQSRFNQQIPNASFSDANLFAVTLTPLLLDTYEGLSIWKNQCSSSVRFCRPISLEFVKETKDLNVKTKLDIEQEISELETFNFVQENGKIITVSFKFHLSMLDGKVLAHITNTKSFQSCTCCGATPSQMNNLQNIGNGKFKADPSSLEYGISPLHCWIRFLDLVLHISYRLPLKKWQIRAENDKLILKARKAEIQASFIEHFNLRVDMPAAGGSGNSNTGNVARKSFSNPALLSKVLGLDEKLLSYLHTILIAVSCDQSLDSEKFRSFCIDTAKLYCQLYDWFPMPSSLHRVLIHGADIVASSTLPLGLLSEEAAEARNKLYKSDRLNHSRKTSRENNMYDMMARSLISSDPILSDFDIKRRMKSLKKKDLPLAVQKLLLTNYDQREKEDSFGQVDNADIELDLEIFHDLNDITLESEYDRV